MRPGEGEVALSWAVPAAGLLSSLHIWEGFYLADTNDV